MVVPGVSIKIEVATGLDRVTDCTNKGLLVPLFYKGGEGGEGEVKVHSAPENFKFQSPKNAIFSVLDARTTDVHSYNIF